MSAAQVSGINVKRTTMIMYAIAGSLYGLAGVLEAARTGGATNNYGNMYELDAIAACVVGGVSVAGGVGTVPGIVAGVLIFSVIDYGLTFVGIDPYWQLIIKGVIIVSRGRLRHSEDGAQAVAASGRARARRTPRARPAGRPHPRRWGSEIVSTHRWPVFPRDRHVVGRGLVPRRSGRPHPLRRGTSPRPTARKAYSQSQAGFSG